MSQFVRARVYVAGRKGSEANVQLSVLLLFLREQKRGGTGDGNHLSGVKTKRRELLDTHTQVKRHMSPLELSCIKTKHTDTIESWVMFDRTRITQVRTRED